MINNDTFRKRYLFKVLSNMVILGTGIINQGIVPRALGPIAYGNFNFLVDFYDKLVSIAAMGTQEGFYTKLSKNLKDRKIILFYSYFVALLVFAVFIVVGCIFAAGYGDALWPNQEIKYIWAGAIYAILYFIMSAFHKMIDAYGYSVNGEKVRMLQRIFSTGILIFLYYFNFLSLTEYFIYNYFVFALLIVAWGGILWEKKILHFERLRLLKNEIYLYFNEFYQYCYPLAIYTVVGASRFIVERLMLQHFAGSVQQGYFWLSYNVGTICFMFTSAMTPLITREFAKSFGENDHEKIRGMFFQHSMLMYTLSAYLAVFVFLQAEKIALLFGGDVYQAANISIAIMAFYPIHQTVGQLSGAVFLATEQTKLYTHINIMFMILGIPLAYFLVAPRNQFGLEMGASGLALKTILLQVVVVNIQLWFNARYLKQSYWMYLFHQIYSVVIFIVLGKAIVFAVNSYVHSSAGSFILSGAIYSIVVLTVVFLLPGIIGRTKEEMQSLFVAPLKRYLKL